MALFIALYQGETFENSKLFGVLDGNNERDIRTYVLCRLIRRREQRQSELLAEEVPTGVQKPVEVKL